MRQFHATIKALAVLILVVSTWAAWAGPGRPTIEVRSGPIVISQSCRVLIPPGTVIRDAAGAGAIQIGESNIEIEFVKGSILRGAPPGVAPDQYQGCGIRLNGHAGVTLRGARISGYSCGLWATKADRLTLERIDASDNRRARLKSTPVAEDASDWLFGHENDHHEWLSNYAAAIYVEQCAGLIVRDSQVWHGQNGLCLDRISDSKIYDNDFSFNSGWGIALWRSSRNVITRNAVDFCVRGYSHGVYNRGQDSAGIFAFEQNNQNIIAENSVTHGGDGFFGFAGREALGETGEHPIDWYKRRGNSDNVLARNDFSYAAAHGIENTFSFGNRYLENRIVGNAICGIWAGYSRDTLIAGNDLEGNGEMGYDLERGGVNIDHGGDNTIVRNRFLKNKCGIHLWGGANADFEKKNWAKANGYASTGSVIADNTFAGDDLAFHFRGDGDVTMGRNRLTKVAREMVDEPGYKVHRNDQLKIPAPGSPSFPVFGRTLPVGARAGLRGRENIIMTEWGPWDHVTPLVRLVKSAGATAVYEILKVPNARVRVEVLGGDARSIVAPVGRKKDESRLTVTARGLGVHPYQLRVQAGAQTIGEIRGTLIAAKWQATFFEWPADIDPRKNLEAYRKLATGPTAVSAVVDELTFKYGMRGPSDLGIADNVTAARFGSDHFGMVARTRLPLAPGAWKIATESDDGVRVTVDGKPVIENWSWHGPTRDTGTFTIDEQRTVEIEVEHFEIDGFATLEFSISR
jgi:parallel beta-helix repeat protein